ncbi:hypothetical protein CLOP_g14796, partial [Closterium sp. NIES-67]
MSSPTLLARQASIYSLTLDEFQAAFAGPSHAVASMPMDDFLRSVWLAEESHMLAAADPRARDRAAGLLRARSLRRQKSAAALPRALTARTVEDVWKDIQAELAGEGEAEEGGGAQQQGRQMSFAEITLEDFLVRAGISKEELIGGIEAIEGEQAGGEEGSGGVGNSARREGEGDAVAQGEEAERRGEGLGATVGEEAGGGGSGGMGAYNGAGSAAMAPDAAAAAAAATAGWALYPHALTPGQANLLSMQLHPHHHHHQQQGQQGQQGGQGGGGGGGGGGAGAGERALRQQAVVEMAAAAVADAGHSHVASAFAATHHAAAAAALGELGTLGSLGAPPAGLPMGLGMGAGMGGGAPVERRQKRMIKNRESAARSRARKQAYTVELEAEVAQLKEENEQLRAQLMTAQTQ